MTQRNISLNLNLFNDPLNLELIAESWHTKQLWSGMTLQEMFKISTCKLVNIVPKVVLFFVLYYIFESFMFHQHSVMATYNVIVR